MKENQPTVPPQPEPESSQSKEVFNQPYIEITEGLPFKNALELYLHLYDTLMGENKNELRSPILGFFDTEQQKIRIFMMGSSVDKRDHDTLLRKLVMTVPDFQNFEKKIRFATAIEGFGFTRMESGYSSEIIELDLKEFYATDAYQNQPFQIPNKVYVHIRLGSDHLDFPMRNAEARSEMARLLSLPGIKINFH